MKVIIAGSRGIEDPLVVLRAVHNSGFLPEITHLASGGARGVDRLGEELARRMGWPVKQFIPDWNGYAGKRAGFVRNVQMAQYADALIAIWDGVSRGTAHMIKTAREHGLRVHVELVK